ncbi:MAG: hypothetical protein ABSB42_18390 [Tepidisphaeraceae bacterium]|jgi:ElaB/YqjD/DUF883 family membrane-anchored ribosome-binding protein
MPRMHETATEELRDKAVQVGKDVLEMGGAVRDVAEEQFDHMRDRASGYVKQGREKVEEWENGLESYIQDNPIRSLLLAAGAGLLVGLLWRRR